MDVNIIRKGNDIGLIYKTIGEATVFIIYLSICSLVGRLCLLSTKTFQGVIRKIRNAEGGGREKIALYVFKKTA